MTLHITERGVHVELAAAELAVRTEGEVRVDAGRIRLHGRDGVDISSDGPVKLTLLSIRPVSFAQRPTAKRRAQALPLQP